MHIAGSLPELPAIEPRVKQSESALLTATITLLCQLCSLVGDYDSDKEGNGEGEHDSDTAGNGDSEVDDESDCDSKVDDDNLEESCSCSACRENVYKVADPVPRGGEDIPLNDIR